MGEGGHVVAGDGALEGQGLVVDDPVQDRAQHRASGLDQQREVGQVGQGRGLDPLDQLGAAHPGELDLAERHADELRIRADPGQMT